MPGPGNAEKRENSDVKSDPGRGQRRWVGSMGGCEGEGFGLIRNGNAGLERSRDGCAWRGYYAIRGRLDADLDDVIL